MSRSYSVGASGDQGRTSDSGTSHGSLSFPETLPAVLPPSLAMAVNSPEAAECTVRRSLRPSRSGIMESSEMDFSGTGSSHTVCQMPDTAVYQMLFGFSTCLPRGCGPVSLGSHTATTISSSPFPFSAPHREAQGRRSQADAGGIQSADLFP